MSERHWLYDVNPKHIDHGELIDSRTGEYIGEACAFQAAASIKAQRIEGVGHGVIRLLDYPGYAVARPREGTTVADWRLGIALGIKAERREFHLRGRKWNPRNGSVHSDETLEALRKLGGDREYMPL